MSESKIIYMNGSKSDYSVDPSDDVSDGMSLVSDGCSSSSEPSKARCRNAVFTFNNYNEDDVNAIIANSQSSATIKYLVFQREVAPTTGTPHLQGYVEFSKACSYRVMEATLLGVKNKVLRMFFSVRKGTAAQASDYCKKSDSRLSGTEPYEYGQISQQGKRNDIESMIKVIQNCGLNPAVDQFPNLALRMNKGMIFLDTHYRSKKPKVPPTVYWFYGPTGTGKSRDALELAGSDVAILSKNLEWFDQYNYNESVIFDDFRGSWGHLSWVLQLLDIYEISVPIKGSFRKWLPKKIFITSAYSPSDCYSHVGDENIDQLLRRIHKIRQYGKVKGKPVYRQIKDIEPVLVAEKAEPISSDVSFDEE